MFHSLPKGDSILAAVSRVESLEAVSLYAVSLAKRTSMEVTLLFVLEQERPGPASPEPDDEELFGKIRRSGAAEGVAIVCRIVRGRFTEEIVRQLRAMGSPILVVGEGKNRRTRILELNRIEMELKADKSWSRRNSPHFLVVAMRKDQTVRAGRGNRRRPGTGAEGDGG